MSAPARRPGGRSAPAREPRRLVAALLAGLLAAGCDHPFHPFQESGDAVFSMYGYLDLNADTQWVRVMPVRQNLLLGPDPIDAVVTLEHVESGRVVELGDSLFRYEDPRLDGVAYAHNFWTTERLRPGASYRLRAARSDGASTTALVVLPADPELSFVPDRSTGRAGTSLALLQVRAEKVLSVEVLYGMGTSSGTPSGAIAKHGHWTFPTGVPGTHGLGVDVDTLVVREGFRDVRRMEIRVAAGAADWPYHAGLPDLAVTLPGVVPSNVENGVGFVGGVATWTIPYDACDVLEPRPGGKHPCATAHHGRSASVAGRVVRAGCGDPHALADVRLTERFAGGGAVVRRWKTGWKGEYRFGGIEPGSELVLDLGPGAPALHLPPLAPGERRTVDDVPVPVDC